MVWIGLVRPMVGYLLLAPCGPVWSKLSASEITLPFFTSLAAAMMSCALVKLSVPISSFGPHLPQFLYFSAASRRSWRVYFLAGMGLPSWVEPEAGRAVQREGRVCCATGCGMIALDHAPAKWSSVRRRECAN